MHCDRALQPVPSRVTVAPFERNRRQGVTYRIRIGNPAQRRGKVTLGQAQVTCFVCGLPTLVGPQPERRLIAITSSFAVDPPVCAPLKH